MAKKKTTNNTNAQSLGKKGGQKGGPARAKKLTRSERQSIASEGGKAKAANAKNRPMPNKKKGN